MNENNVPYIAHESAMARMERIIKRLWVLVLVLAFMLIATNAAWLWYESQWQTVETYRDIYQEIDAQDSGNATILDGIHINGTDTTGN